MQSTVFSGPLVLATRNPDKVAEICAILAAVDATILSAADFPDMREVNEDAPTLEGNAAKKALAWREHTGRPALADDTALEVVALDGAPGVFSARFAGPDSDEKRNRAKLLEALRLATDRTARFRTVLAFADKERVHFFEGICSGAITHTARGSGGFGYDPLFVPDGFDRTFAEMTAEEKNAISHRYRALRKFAEYITRRASFRDGGRRNE